MTFVGDTVREYHWSWKKKPVTVVYEVLGEGQPILLLPAFSSVSSYTEMMALAKLLAQHYQVIVPDWVGFGRSSRPAFRYNPALYHAFLRDFVQATFTEPVVVIAAGHAAGYVMKLANRQPPVWSWVVLVAPTWRGPLPTTMGEHRWFYSILRFLVRLPLMGQMLYMLNTLPSFLGWMYRRHVYADADHVTAALISQKRRSMQQKGARFASAAFVTGALDPVRKRNEFFDYFQPLPPVPVMMVIGEEMPPKSRAEVEVAAHFFGLQVYRMPGALGLHEEYPDQLAEAILPFLKKYLS
jgi:pimeloyl-ACP methyl ester carboxylesterase